MMHAVKRAVLAVALMATTVGVATTAEARDRYGRRGGGDDAAIAIGAGVVGLALGAALASDHHRRGYYRQRYYYPRSRYRNYYYYDNYPNYYYNVYPRHRNYQYRNRYYGNRYDGDGYRGSRYYGNGYSNYGYREHHRRHGGW